EVGAADLAVTDHVQPGPLLIRDGNRGGVLDQLSQVGLAQLAAADMLACELIPAWDSVAADDCGGNRGQVVADGHSTIVGECWAMSDGFQGWPEEAQRFLLGLQLDNSKAYYEADRATGCGPGRSWPG